MSDSVERPGAQQWVPEPATVEDLRAAAPACRGCELWEPATQVVFSAGDDRARVVLVGEQPGDVEDRRGIPFVGPAGRLLQDALDQAGVDRGCVYVTNAVKHFRFTVRGKRRIHATPEAAHVAACRPWLTAELRAVDPDVVVCLGATAVRALLGADVRVMRDRGRPMRRETSLGEKTFVVTVHPSSVLRGPVEKRDEAFAALVADLRVVAEVAGSEG
ncbi:MAG: UdgX family uracil-DNA binding protein [Actinomycetes bacterium]